MKSIVTSLFLLLVFTLPGFSQLRPIQDNKGRWGYADANGNVKTNFGPFYFGVGNISIKAANSCVYSVQAIKDLDVILNHFDKYPLITKKHADYLLFKMAINLIKEKAHLNPEGLRKLVAIRASLN